MYVDRKAKAASNVTEGNSHVILTCYECTTTGKQGIQFPMIRKHIYECDFVSYIFVNTFCSECNSYPISVNFTGMHAH